VVAKNDGSDGIDRHTAVWPENSICMGGLPSFRLDDAMTDLSASMASADIFRMIARFGLAELWSSDGKGRGIAGESKGGKERKISERKAIQRSKRETSVNGQCGFDRTSPSLARGHQWISPVLQSTCPDLPSFSLKIFVVFITRDQKGNSEANYSRTSTSELKNFPNFSDRSITSEATVVQGAHISHI
jgi:hypothetical protein